MAPWRGERLRQLEGWRRRNGVGMDHLALLVLALGIAVFTAGVAVRIAGRRDADLVVGVVEDARIRGPAATIGGTPLAGPEEEAAAAADGPGIRAGWTRSAAARPSGQPLLDPDGRPYGAPIPFDSSIPVPDGLVWVLLVGSDARPGEPVLRSRADSVHLLAANPATGQATIIGFPRDAFVEIPGHGRGKINTALVLGGPDLLAETVHRFTGLPVQLWVVAGFAAFKDVIDGVGGVDVEVTARMDDWDSGARFRPGYHHFDGEQALAFSRDRHDFADGDLTRSHNQGALMLAALAKLRSEVGDEAGLGRWLGVAFRHLSLSTDRDAALQLLALGRRTDPADVTNLVLAGRGGMAGAQSVVYLDPPAAAAVADDVRPDAAIGPARDVRPPTSTTVDTPSAPVITAPGTTARPGSTSTSPSSSSTSSPSSLQP